MKKILLALVVAVMMTQAVSATWYCPWGPCFPGWDFDFVPDDMDNCPSKFNPSQRNADGDEWGDACDLNDLDSDWDEVTDNTDNCVYAYNPSQRDNDTDGHGDMCDFNLFDFDWDGTRNYDDNCLFIYNPSQADWNGNEIGDMCDCMWFWFRGYCP